MFSWPPLGSSWAPVGSSWPPLGSSWASLRRSGTRFLRTFLWVSPWDLYFRFRSSWAPLGFLLAPLGVFLGSPETLQDSFFTSVFVGLSLGPVFWASGLQKTFFWAPLGSSWAPLGLLSAPLGLLLGSSWVLLAPHELLLASSWLLFLAAGLFPKMILSTSSCALAFLLGSSWALLDPLGLVLGSSWVPLGLPKAAFELSLVLPPASEPS